MLLRSVALVVVVTTSCKGQSIDPRSRFVEDGVQKSATAAWSAERIEIDTTGVTAGGGLGLAATDTDRVVATARMLAVADTYDKESADKVITSATEGFLVATTAGVTTVHCGHGVAEKSVAAEESGCDALDVAVPRGAPDRRLTIVARSGTGKVGVSLASAALAGLDVHSSNGSIDASVPATQGAILSIVSDTADVVTLRLPRDFATDALVLMAPAVDTSAFPDVQAGKGRGQAGIGAKTITVQAGRIVLAVQQ